MRAHILIAVAATLLAAPAASQTVVGKQSFKTIPSLVTLDTTGMFQAAYARAGDDLYIGGQPTEKALRDLKAQGVTTVINLRMPQEMERIGFDEKKLIEELGMKYVHIPMRGGTGEMSYSPATLAKFTEALKGAQGKVLLHCTVAWRASHIWGAFLIQEGLPEADVIRHTRAINLMDEHRADAGSQPIEMFLGRRLAGLGRP